MWRTMLAFAMLYGSADLCRAEPAVGATYEPPEEVNLALVVHGNVFVMGVGREDNLAVADVLLFLAAQEFGRYQFEIFRRAQAVTNGHVDVDEVGEIGELVPCFQAFNGIGGQRDAVALGKSQQRGRPDGAFEVHVQLDLGHEADELIY